ncbi:hypothetical protein BU23DRAFT_551840 [Bimuria novae-zelandiae CBS 107.79]|uniref:Ribosomal protein S21 n=1 Tax=Bimuria novae-zelandiae CBS 107.79 TaxID=1447943 RepID=A0A6A5VIA0_9PLEO|nr:hypothetical protein BU23DRAFT_551840 [Bimuria novae-zelandiae CBS 107.79]
MGPRSLGEPLLRPSSLSRLFFAQNFPRTVPSWHTHRLISQSSTPPPAQPQPRERTTPKVHAQQPTNAPARKQTPTGADRTSEAIDSLFGGMPSYRGRSAPGPASAQKSAQMAANLFGANFAQGGTRQNFIRRGLDMDSMDMSGLPMPLQDLKPAAPAVPEEQHFPRLNPAYGRTINLQEERGRDIVRGINMLGSLMARNNVRADFMKQRFHERGGLRRKRLKSERWRARFKRGFQDVTARVSELTRKGW